MIEYAVDDFLRDVKYELCFAREKFPSSDGVMAALTEETGELAKAHMEEPWGRVRKEAVQVATMALRIALEGDATLLSVRQARNQADGPKCPYAGCENAFTANPPCALCYE